MYVCMYVCVCVVSTDLVLVVRGPGKVLLSQTPKGTRRHSTKTNVSRHL